MIADDHPGNDPTYQALFREEAEVLLARLSDGILALERPADRDGEGRLVDDLFRSAHSLKGAARMVGREEVAHTAHRLEDALDGLRRGTLRMAPALADALLAVVDAVQASLDGGGDTGAMQAALRRLDEARLGVAEAKATVPPVVPGRTNAMESVGARIAGARVGVPAERLDRLLRLAGQLLARRDSDRLRAAEARAVARALSEVGAAARAEATPSSVRAALLDARVGAERLARTLAHDAGAYTSLVDDLYLEASQARMVGMGALFGGLRRTVRDAERSVGKRVDLHLEGEDTVVDSRVLDALRDPLVHLVRNAVDHGIEPGAERARQGKPERGQLRVSATPDGERVMIRVEDDGAGLDAARFREAAARGGLLQAEVAALLTDEAATALMFRPGFSTRAEATELSGRGVGMDVVRTTVEALGGQIGVWSKVGTGTGFTISVPLSVATLRVVLVAVRAGGENGPPERDDHGARQERTATFTYAVAADAVERALALPASVRGRWGEDTEAARGVGRDPSFEVEVDGTRVPLRWLGRLLGIPAGRPEVALLVHDGTSRVALAVDEVIGEASVVVEPLGPLVGDGTGAAGGSILPNGNVAILLRPGPLVWAGLAAGSAGGARRLPGRQEVPDPPAGPGST